MQSAHFPRQALVLFALAALGVAGASGCRNDAGDDAAPPKQSEPASNPTAPVSPETSAEAEAKLDAELAAADLSARKIEANQPLRLATGNAGVHRADGTNAPAVAAQLARRLAASGALQASARSGRTVVQVNRAINDTLVPVDRSAITAVVEDAVTAGHPTVVTTAMIHGDSQTTQVKAVHMAFDTESKALGIIPSHSLNDAPDVFINTVVSKDDSGEKVTVTIISADTGKVLGSESGSL